MDDFSHWKDGKELDDDATISTTHPKKSPTFFGKSPTFLENLPRFWKNVGDFLRNVPCFFLFLQHLPQCCCTFKIEVQKISP